MAGNFAYWDLDKRQRESLALAINNEPWYTLRTMGDLATEQGDGRTPWVIAWIAKYRRYPGCSSRFGYRGDLVEEYYWYPKDMSSGEYDTIHHLLQGRSSHAVPTWRADFDLKRKKDDRDISLFSAYWNLINHLRYYLDRLQVAEWEVMNRYRDIKGYGAMEWEEYQQKGYPLDWGF